MVNTYKLGFILGYLRDCDLPDDIAKICNELLAECAEEERKKEEKNANERNRKALSAAKKKEQIASVAKVEVKKK